MDLSSFEVNLRGMARRPGGRPAYQAVRDRFGDEGDLLVALAEPYVMGLDDMSLITGRRVRQVIAAPEDVELLIQRVAGGGDPMDVVEESDEDYGTTPEDALDTSCWTPTTRRAPSHPGPPDHRPGGRARRL